MRYGTIVKYFPDKQYGFIQPDTGQDVFFHISALGACQAAPEIKIGQSVKFEVMSRKEARADRPLDEGERSAEDKRSEQPKAKLVELLDKPPGATLAEFDESQPSSRHPTARKKKPTWRR